MESTLIAIVGAPNVGKSTLFNRLVGERKSIVTDEAGVTRDRIYGQVRLGSRRFRIVDTGGWTGERPTSGVSAGIDAQASAALDEAAAVVLVVDARCGPTALDRELAGMLRRRSRPVIVAANKVDSPSLEPLVHPFFELGVGEVLAVSAEHDLGMEALLEALARSIPDDRAPPDFDDAGPPVPSGSAPPVRVAIVGRPNVGKSSLLNRILGEDRHLVSEAPGTTRDAVDTIVERGGRRYLLVDTAGIRRRGRVLHGVESLAVLQARKSIERADVVVLVVDAAEELAAQDAHIAGYARDARKPLVVLANKWDVIDARESAAKEWMRAVRERLRFARHTPLILASAKTGQRVERLFAEVDAVHAAAGIRVPTPEVNRWLRDTTAGEPRATAGKKTIRFYYATQAGTHPPRFVLFCSDPRGVHFSLRRRLENSLRERFGFGPAPIELQFRSRRPRKHA